MSHLQTTYNNAFYETQMRESYNSALEVLAFVKTILPTPSNVIDVGCGVGTWLKAWQEIDKGIEIYGIDGNCVNPALYQIPLEQYQQVDLTQNFQATLKAVAAQNGGGGGTKPFSLAQSFEVAEHLEKEDADNFIALLTSLSDVILFSAAIPNQGGEHHVNEQPPHYWAEIFARYDFVCFDIVRGVIWDNPKVASWYRQNTLIFIHQSKIELLTNQGFTPTHKPLHLVHYDLFKLYHGMYINLKTRHEKRILVRCKRLLQKLKKIITKG